MADENIRFNIEMETKDAEASLKKFKTVAENAFNSSSTKVQDMGVRIDRVNGRLSNYINEVNKLKTTVVPTKQYTELERQIDKVGKEYDKTKAKADKLAEVQVPTERYQTLNNQLNTTKTEVKSLETELSKMKETATFSALSKTAQSYLNKLSKIEAELAILKSAGANATNSEDYVKLTADADKYRQKVSDACTALEQLQEEGKRYVNQNEFETKTSQLQILKGVVAATEVAMLKLENTDQAYTHSTAFDEQTAKAKTLETEYNNLIAQKAQWDKEGTNGGGFTTQADLATTKMQKLETAIQGCINQNQVNANKVQEITARESELENQTGRVRNATRNMGSSFTSAKTHVNSLANTFKRFASSAVSKIKKVASTLKNRLSGEITSTKNTSNNSFKSMLTQVLKYGFGIRSIFLLYKKIRTTIKTGLGEMAKDFDDVNESASELYNSWNTFKSSIISAFEPIYTYVVPALSTMLDYMTEVMNSLANFFANLTGASTYKKAIKQNNDYADSLSSTADSASDATEELATYDELLVITTDSTSDSSSSTTDTWQWIEVATEASEWAELIQDALTDWDFTEVGEKLNDALVSAMQSINWDTVYSYAENFGKGLATFLNGLIDDELFSELGKTIANALNTAFTFVNTFAENFEWDELGDAIASGINSFVSNFNIKLAVSAFNKVANGILDTLISAVSGVDWQKVSDAITDGINTLDTSGLGSRLGKFVSGLANALYTLVSNKDTWSSLGSKIADGLNGFFTSMNEVNKKTGLTGWEALGKSISDTFSGIGNALIKALEDTNWEEVGKGIADFISSIQWDEVWFTFKDLLSAIGKAIVRTLDGADIDAHDVWVTISGLGAIIATLAGITLASSLTKSVLTTMLTGSFTKVAGTTPLIKLVGLSILLGSIVISNKGNSLLENAFWDFASAAGVLVGAKMLGFSGAVAFKLAALSLTWNIAWDLTTAFERQLIDWGFVDADSGLGQSIMWVSEVGWKGVVKDIFLYLDEEADDNRNELISKVAEKAGMEYDANTGYFTKDGQLVYNIKTDTYFDDSDDGIADKAKDFVAKAKEKVLNEVEDEVLDAGAKIADGAAEGYDNEQEKAFDQPLKNTLTTITTGLNNEFDMHSPSRAMNPYGSNILLGIVNGFTSMFTSIPTAIQSFKTTVLTNLQENIPSIVDYFSTTYNSITSIFSGIGTWFGDKFQGAWDAVTRVFAPASQFFDTLFGDMTSSFESMDASVSDALFETVSESVNSMFTKVETSLNTGIGLINSAISTLNLIPSVDIGTVNEVSFTKFATGGIVDKAMFGLIGEAGTEAVVPLENNLGWLQKMSTMITDVAIPEITQGLVLPMSQEFIKATSDGTIESAQTLTVDDIVSAVSQAIEMNKSDEDHAPIVVAIEGKQVAQVVWNESEKRYKQTGVRPAYT